MRCLATLLHALMLVVAVWTPFPGLCDQALTDTHRAATENSCCAQGTGSAGRDAPAAAGRHGSCCGHEARCDQPCHVALVFNLQPASAPRFDSDLLGVVDAVVERLHGIDDSPEPRPPARHAA